MSWRNKRGGRLQKKGFSASEISEACLVQT